MIQTNVTYCISSEWAFSTLQFTFSISSH